MSRHEFLETVAVADCSMEIEGDDLDDLFATAARLVSEVMVDPATVRAIERRVEPAAPSLDLLGPIDRATTALRADLEAEVGAG